MIKEYDIWTACAAPVPDVLCPLEQYTMCHRMQQPTEERQRVGMEPVQLCDDACTLVYQRLESVAVVKILLDTCNANAPVIAHTAEHHVGATWQSELLVKLPPGYRSNPRPHRATKESSTLKHITEKGSASSK